MKKLFAPVGVTLAGIIFIMTLSVVTYAPRDDNTITKIDKLPAHVIPQTVITQESWVQVGAQDYGVATIRTANDLLVIDSSTR